ncbi:uncharacterized protein CLUP02_00705 [Colletotrichum lupini]|uniref:Uncharacterized protein n=1 Tax=Colletotrichum lupini TaxID=145971 RepID=A0A9Q8SBL4_9PEZI|nr:uncharacterized protein CLUP02_00705 [Colletotrichum lupini]UQC74058.1 hypothetical protein CLUP02_00705 [Colletotrichum lupini]
MMGVPFVELRPVYRHRVHTTLQCINRKFPFLEASQPLKIVPARVELSAGAVRTPSWNCRVLQRPSNGSVRAHGPVFDDDAENRQREKRLHNGALPSYLPFAAHQNIDVISSGPIRDARGFILPQPPVPQTMQPQTLCAMCTARRHVCTRQQTTMHVCSHDRSTDDIGTVSRKTLKRNNFQVWALHLVNAVAHLSLENQSCSRHDGRASFSTNPSSCLKSIPPRLGCSRVAPGQDPKIPRPLNIVEEGKQTESPLTVEYRLLVNLLCNKHSSRELQPSAKILKFKAEIIEYHSLCQLSYAACGAIIAAMPRVNKRPSLSTSYQHPTVYKINEAYGNTPKEIKLIFSPQFESIFSKVSHVGREAGVSSKVGTYHTTRINQKTYNSRYALVVTDPTTNPALIGLSMGERTGSRIFQWKEVCVVVKSGIPEPSLDSTKEHERDNREYVPCRIVLLQTSWAT